MKKIVITGGAGFVGSNLSQYLIKKKNIKVNIIDNLTTGKLGNLSEILKNGNLKFFKGNFSNSKLLKKAAKNSDTIIHMATTNLRVSLSNPNETIKNNLISYYKMLNSIKNIKNIKNIIYVSSSEVYGDSNDKYKDEKNTVCEPKTIYASTKLSGEYLTKNFSEKYKLNYIIIRPFNLFGKYSHLYGPSAEVIPRIILQLLKNKRPYIFGSGKQKRDFCEISYVVEGIYKCLKNLKKINRKTINIGTGKPISINELNLIISKVLQKKIKPIYLKERPGDYHHLSAKNEIIKKIYKKKTNTRKEITKFTIQLKNQFKNQSIYKVEKYNWN